MKVSCVLLGLLSALLLSCNAAAPTPAATPGITMAREHAAATAVRTDAAAPASTPTAPRPGAPAPGGATPPMPRGRVDPGLMVDVYEPASVSVGTTLLSFQADSQNPEIIEVNALGEIVWEYPLPPELKRFTNHGFDAELLPNNHVLFVLPGNGVYEIDRSGKVIWTYLTQKISHDADRLPNGNTIFVFGNFDTKSDPQVVEVSASGQVVWSWFARDYFDRPPYADISNDGWTHTNAMQRLANGNTLISPMNFDFVIEVDSKGAVVRTIGYGILHEAHDPVQLPSGNILMATHQDRNKEASKNNTARAVELDGSTGRIVWEYPMASHATWPVRDANRLPNGNTLITGSTAIVEVTAQGRVGWRLRLTRTFSSPKDAPALGFYKAERIAATP